MCMYIFIYLQAWICIKIKSIETGRKRNALDVPFLTGFFCRVFSHEKRIAFQDVLETSRKRLRTPFWGPSWGQDGLQIAFFWVHF